MRMPACLRCVRQWGTCRTAWQISDEQVETKRFYAACRSLVVYNRWAVWFGTDLEWLNTISSGFSMSTSPPKYIWWYTNLVTLKTNNWHSAPTSSANTPWWYDSMALSQTLLQFPWRCGYQQCQQQTNTNATNQCNLSLLAYLRYGHQ